MLDHQREDAVRIKSALTDLMEGTISPSNERSTKILSTLSIAEGKTIAFVDVIKLANAGLIDFATLDFDFLYTINYLCKSIQYYISDYTLRRPCNILLVAQPGSGKSHFVNCLGKHLRVPVVAANMATPEAADALSVAVNEARNYKATDRTPIIFLDEVDDKENGFSFSTLLPLLWDGQLWAHRQNLSIGRCVIICAVSDEDLRDFAQIGTKEKLVEKRYGKKTRDFISRFDAGVFEIPSINNASRKLDKPVIAVSLLQRRFSIINEIQISLLRLVYECTFIHEVRSLENFVNKIPIYAVHKLPDNRTRLTVSYFDDRTNYDYVNDLLEKLYRTPLGQHISSPSGSPLDVWRNIIPEKSLTSSQYVQIS